MEEGTAPWGSRLSSAMDSALCSNGEGAVVVHNSMEGAQLWSQGEAQGLICALDWARTRAGYVWWCCGDPTEGLSQPGSGLLSLPRGVVGGVDVGLEEAHSCAPGHGSCGWMADQGGGRLRGVVSWVDLGQPRRVHGHGFRTWGLPWPGRECWRLGS